MGTGTTDIIERCEKHGLRTPEFIQDEDFTTIIWRPALMDEELEVESKDNTGIVPQDVPQDVPRDVPRDVPQDVPRDVPQAIAALIKNNPKITREDIALQLGPSVKTIGRYIAKLPNIKYVGSGYSGHWEIVE